MNGNYRHTQHAPLCLPVYGTAVMFLVLVWVLRNEPVVQWVFPAAGLLMLILAASFHHLTVEDEGDRLSISFGPLPLFRRSIKYENIVSVEVGRTTILDGWGIHMSFRGGWVCSEFLASSALSVFPSRTTAAHNRNPTRHGMHTMTHPDILKTKHPDWFALYGGKRDTQTGKRLNHLC